MKYFLPVLLLVLIGCGSSLNITTYRPAGSTESPWRVVAAKSNSGDRVEVSINDSLVCSASIGVFGSSDEATGEYRGHKVVCMLQKTSAFLKTGLQCIVMIDGEMAGKFEW